MRLHCFAHSGDGVSVFDGWRSAVGPGVEPVAVRLSAARGGRALTTRQDLLAEVLPRLTTPPSGGPYALYGHGLGALAAFTVARALQERGAAPPVLLAVGACPPPVPAWAPAPHTSDADLLRLLGQDTVIPPASDEGVFLRAMLPVLRADLELAHSLHEAARTPSDAPAPASALLVVASQDNPLAPASIAEGWRQFTRGPVHLRTVPGRHFFVRGGRALPRLLGRACRVARRLALQPAPIG
ncbi:thioesterase II family protein [Streptomyces flavalbus]|uniref:Thioesterase II family protein n=1 Tax=Streptomyces flavalbus TaxID=2665155 RepID=A0ABW2WM43_9ACTN